MLSTDEATELTRQLQITRRKLLERFEDAISAVRVDSTAAVATELHVQEATAGLERAIQDLATLDEVLQASYFGDAYQINQMIGDVYDVPDRVRGAPTLALHMSLFPGETPVAGAVERFTESLQASGLPVPPMVVKGSCAGMKEIVCRLIHTFFGLSKGDI